MENPFSIFEELRIGRVFSLTPTNDGCVCHYSIEKNGYSAKLGYTWDTEKYSLYCQTLDKLFDIKDATREEIEEALKQLWYIDF